LSGIGLEVGRGVDATATTSPLDYFAGQLRDLRLWKVARTREQIAANRYEQPELSDDLVGYWPFDEASGVTAADHSVGSHNPLRLGGIEAARRPVINDPSVVFVFPEIRDYTLEPAGTNLAKDPGLFDPAALKLDGNSNYVEIPDGQVPQLDEATFEAWVKPDKLIGDATLWDQPNNALKLAWLDNRLKLSVAGNDPQQQTFDFGFDVNEWVHIALVYSRTNQNAQLYINEHLIAEDKTTYKVANPLAISAALVGQNRNNLGNLRGLIKELRWWSVARTPEQIQTYLFRRLAGDEKNLVVYLPCNEETSLKHAPAWVSPDLLDSSLGQGFWNGKRLAAVFDGKDGLVYWSDSAGGQTSVCQRRTVEVWFKADDKDITSRKQVIYHEGDDKHGLSIYLFDGQLYFGGYNLLDDKQDWGHWAGTWLSTNRVHSGKWHHAALVLDGRDEVRASSLQAFLDGKFVAEGNGAQLSQCSSNLALGGISGRILFHDGLPGSVVPQPTGASFLQGQILDLRVWNTARSPHQLQLYRYRQLTGRESDLERWWQFEHVEEEQIPDLAGHGHVGLLMPSVQIQPIDTLPKTPPAEDILAGLAKIKRLADKYQLPMDQLTSLWYEIRHTGKANGEPLFDNIFNPRGSVFPAWTFYMDAPIRWDRTGATDQTLSRQIRSRLMGALRVSYDNLNNLVNILSGADETIIELDSEYLTNLYRLARLPGLLHLNVTEFTSLLKLLGLDKVDSLDRFALVSDRVDWIQQLGINVFQLDFLSTDQQSDRVTFPYNDSSIRDLADSLRRQSSEFLAQETSFATSEVSTLQSLGLFKLLGSLGDIDQIGAVELAYAPPLHFDKLFFLGAANASPDATELRLNLTEVAFATLTQDQIGTLKTNRIIDDNGLVLDEHSQGILLDPDPVKANFTDTRLKPLFANADANMLSIVREALERDLKIQTDFASKLIGMRDALAAATLAGLSSLVGAPPDRTLAVAQHLATDMTLKQFFVILFGIHPDAEHKDRLPIPGTLTAKPTGYLYKLSKILYLAGQFNLTLDETVALVDNPQHFTVKNILQPDFSDLTNLYLFTTLKSAFNDTTGKLINVFGTDGKGSAAITAIQDLTGWEVRQIEALMAYFGNELEYNRVAGLDRLRVIFEIAATMHVDVEFVTQVADTGELSIDFYARQSANLLEVLRSQYDDEQWSQVSRPIHDRLAVQMRDALLARAMLNISPDFAGRRSPDVLSEYLLLDLQTGSEVDTSRVVQATASLQLYVQRCMLNLERGIDPASVPTDQWEWMKNYRVWEANRKVFLYPENYIEPELRDNKTPFFQELEQDLIQGEINQNLVEQAYTNYLNKFAEVANLKIVGSHYHTVDAAEVTDGLKGKNVLYLLGRTRTQPYVYYLRQYIEGEQWMPWQKINITINADSVTPVYAFNRLFIFWVEFMKTTESRDTGEPVQVGNSTLAKQGNVDVFKATVKYTYQNLAKEWVQPQFFMDAGRNLEKNEVVLEEWQHVYLLRSLEFFPSGAPPEPTISDPNVTVLQIEANPQINGETELKVAIPSMAMDKLTWSFWVNFINNSTQGFTSIQPPRGQSLRLVYYNNPRIPGLPGSDNDFVIDVTSNITPASGAPNVQSARAERDKAREDLAALMVDDQATLGQLQIAQGKLDTAENNYQDGLITEPKPSNFDTLKVTRDSARSELASLEAQTRVQDTQLTTAQNNRDSAETAYQNTLQTDPTASNLGTLKQEWDDAAGKFLALQKKQAAQDHLSQAERVYQNAVDAPKWQTTALTLAVHIGASVIETKLLYGSWQYIAVTMDYDPVTGAYAVQLLVDGIAQVPQAQYQSNIFTPGRDLTIGQQVRDLQGKFEPGKGIPEQYTVQLSEFQLWKQARPAALIESERFKRYATNLLVQGVFAIPLDRRESSAQLNLQPSKPGLNLQRGATPKPPIERERILLLWGKDVRRCIRNTLATEKSLNLVLEDPNTIPAINVASQYEYEVAANILYAQALTLVGRLAVFPPVYANLYPPLVSIPSSLGPMLGISNTPAGLDALGKLVSVASIDERWATAYDSFSAQWFGLTPLGPNAVFIPPSTSLSELRNTAIAYLNLIRAGNTHPLSYSLNLSLNQLYIQKTNKLSIHAYAADIFGMLTPPLNRFTPEIRRFIVAAANRAYSLTEPEAQQFRAEIASLSAFGVADIQANQPDRLKAFLKSSFGVEGVSIPQPLPATSQEVLLANVLSYDATFMEVNNQPGWYILDTGDEQFLIKTIGRQPLKSAKDRIEFIYGASTNDGSPQPLTMRLRVDDALVARDSNPLSDFRFEFERLSTYVIHDLSLSLFAGGIDSLLSLDSQRVPEIDLQKQYQAGVLVTPPNFDRATNTIRTGIDFDGPNGLYYREIFFHIPFLIANQLNANQKFAEAQKWYHYIFDPTTSEPTGLSVNPNDRYWRFRPFRDLSLETLRQILSNKDALAEYRDHPFDPHAIARLRLNAYQKAIVMKYINNLLDWGDNLFAQDTREAIGEAAQLYILAYNLLGQRPQSKVVKDFREVGTYDDIIAANKDGLPDFLAELDKPIPIPAGDGALQLTPINNIITDFGVTENDVFMGYWDRVEDRLFKIRHSLNLEGVFRQLALFQPPINPMALVSAIAGGRDLGSVLSDLNVAVPNYRFLFLMDKAKEMASTVNDLGAALLDALEKRDAEGLTRLQNSQEKQILDLTTAIKKNELDSAKKSVESLNQSKTALETKKQYYTKLSSGDLNPAEKAYFAVKGIALVNKAVEGVLSAIAEGLETIPDVITGAEGVGGSPAALAKIGSKEVRSPIATAAIALRAVGEGLDLAADISEKRGEFDRRKQEWDFEAANVQKEINEITYEIAIAELQSSIAEQELAIHMKTIEQNQEIADFYRSKFTSKDLYNWMVSQLSGLYFQAYKLAYDYAKSTEKALQLERLTSNTFISFGHWDSLKKGLLSGSSLLLELSRMEKFYLDQSKRYFEIEKNISMQKSMPDALKSLISTGTADFQLTEKLFDQDYFGHYGRTIKSIAISVNTSTPIDPYDSVHATLTQLGSKTILAPDVNAVLYLLGAAGANQPDSSVLRVNWRANQQIAISNVSADNGTFAIDFFFDDRYFPFEGTGAISSWRLEMPKETNRFDFNSITDVIIDVKYTALADSGAFKQSVAKAMSNLKNG
jgi:Tc toxin complex TcA C-terminal TcB-binding domain/Neuraminidase-like domain/Concanavalin A-like lectin/glucanases superfamily